MGIAAYLAWGVLPLYWPLFRPAGAGEILAHRITWSVVFLAILLLRGGGLARLRVGARRLWTLLGASCFIGVNWGLYIWSVNAGHVVEAALGYFINPLVTVVLGVVVLGERLRRAQWAALALAAGAVAVLTLDYGRPPWIALALASTFALYGLLKKRAGVGAVESLTIETSALVLPAVAYIVWLDRTGAGVFVRGSWTTTALLVSSGVITALPLLAFAGAANRIPLRTLGPLQYISPSLQFLCGVLVYGEAMPPSRWIGFLLVWTSLGVFVADGVAARRATSGKTGTSPA